MQTKLLCVFSEDDCSVKSENFDDYVKVEHDTAGPSNSDEAVFIGSNSGYNRNYRGGRCFNNSGRGNMRKQNQFRQGQDSSRKRNVLDEDGNVTTCGFCGSIYHYIGKCPDKARHLSSESKREFNL